MPTFEYLALDQNGKSKRGSIAAESPSAARRQLRTRRLHATRMRPISEAAHAGAWELSKIFRARRRRALLLFTRQLATMINADVQLTESLEVLLSNTDDQKFSQVIQNVRDQVIAGDSFADSLKEFGEWFDPIYVAMVRVGEVTGNLGRSLKLLADHMNKKQRLETKVKSALTYPAILVVISFLVIIILMTYVVPKITGILTKSGRPLPGITVMLMDFSKMLVDWWWAILIVVFVGVWLIRKSLATIKGQLVRDRLLLKIPILGEFIRQGIVARFASTLAALIRSGMPMADSLKIVAEVTGNTVLAQAVRASRERIIGGADIATPLRDSKVVDTTTAHMISVGERTGELETMLLTISESLEESTDTNVQRISSVIEPLIIVIMAVVVGIIMIATLLPIVQVADLGKM